MNYKALAKKLKGIYTHESHCHKNKRLPFVITGIFFNNIFPIECINVTYDGRQKNTIRSGWTYKSVKKMIDSGYLRKEK